MAEQLPQESPLAVFPIFPEKAERRRRVREAPQMGQVIFLGSSLLSKRISKGRPHLTHSNS